MSLLRTLKEDVKDFPATMALGAGWVLVFIAMLVHQAYWGGGLTFRMFLTGTLNSPRFGALTLGNLYRGEVWLLLTATFVHYGLLHIGMNLYAYYQLGCLVESWYGSGTSIAIYVLTGGGGNLLASLMRHALGSNPLIVSGGGSTVVMGLVALCAVVGWRARSRTGDHLRNQMVLAIILTAGLGLFFTLSGKPVIDNWGHAGGATIGAVIGLASPFLIRHARGLTARLTGWLMTALLATCAMTQVVQDDGAKPNRSNQQAQVEQTIRRLNADERLLIRLDEIRKTYDAVARPRALRRGGIIREIPRRISPAPAPAETKSGTRPATKAKTTSESKEETRPTTPAANSPKSALPPNPAPKSPSPAQPRISVTLDPEQEMAFFVLTGCMRSMNSMAPELEPRSTSAEYHGAREILESTLVDVPNFQVTLEDVRRFEQCLVKMREAVRRERDALRRTLASVARP